MGEDLLFRNTMFQGDCRNVMPLLYDSSRRRFDVVFADPPYNLSGNGLKWTNKRGGGDWHMVNESWDRFGAGSYSEFTRCWIQQCLRLLKPSGSIFVCCTYHNLSHVMGTLEQEGARCLNLIVWQKTNPVPNMTRRTLTHSCEYLAWFVAGKKWTYNYELMKEEPDAAGKQLRDLWRFPVCQGAERMRGDDRRAAHPTQKPLALVRRALRATTHPGYSVLDPFMGSGTTAAAAQELGLHWIGIESEEKYIELTRQRLSGRGAEFQIVVRPTLGDLVEAEVAGPSRLISRREPPTRIHRSAMSRRS